MAAFLCVSKASTEEPVFLEVQYRGDKSSSKHAALVGKGIPFSALTCYGSL